MAEAAYKAAEAKREAAEEAGDEEALKHWTE
jgi:hypothetical protein